MLDTEARVIVMVRWTDKYADRQIDRKWHFRSVAYAMLEYRDRQHINSLTK